MKALSESRVTGCSADAWPPVVCAERAQTATAAPLHAGTFRSLILTGTHTALQEYLHSGSSDSI